MAIAEVQKVQIIARSRTRTELLSSLQEEGLVQLEEVDFEQLGLKNSSPETSTVEHSLHRLSHALAYLSRWEKKGFMERLLAEKPKVERQKRENILNLDYLPVLDKIAELEAKKNELAAEIRFLEKENEFLSPLKNLELPVRSLRETDSTDIVLGSLPLSRQEDFEEMIKEGACWHQVISQGRRRLTVLLIYSKNEKTHLEQALKELEFSPLYFTEPVLSTADEKDRVEDVIEKIDKELKEKRKDIEDIDREGQKLCVHQERLMLVHDVLFNEKEKISSSRFLGETESVFYLEGWIRSSEIKKLGKRLRSFSEETEVSFRPPLPDEDPPVILENPKPGKPFELITKLYGLPQHRSFDPTLSLAPFFFIFVGLCVSEAGYGLLLALLSLLYIKFKKPKAGALRFAQLLLLLGVSNVIFGTLVGGWFGFPIRQLMVIDPLQNPFSFLILSLALGFVQVWFGTLLNLIDGVKNKLYLQSIFVQGGWLLLLPSLGLYGLTGKSIWGILSLVGAAGIVFFASPKRNPLARFFGGLYSLYDISGYVGDILSYSRLLALGLSTTVIAMVVNTLCQTVLGIPWIGWFIAALIFVGGHTFNLAISFLGGFVHSMRLQFVEFFKRFFKSGGKPFKPFELESKYVEFI